MVFVWTSVPTELQHENLSLSLIAKKNKLHALIFPAHTGLNHLPSAASNNIISISFFFKNLFQQQEVPCSCSCAWRLLFTEIDVAFPREPSQARRLALPPVPLNPWLANLYHTTALPAGRQRVSKSRAALAPRKNHCLTEQTNEQKKNRGKGTLTRCR